MINKEKIANIIYNELSYMYCDNCRYNSEIGRDEEEWHCDDCHRKYNAWGISMAEAERIAEKIQCTERTGECRTCARNADNGGYYEPERRTRCPIQEHYALLLDGYCHLYEPYDCGAKMSGDEE